MGYEYDVALSFVAQDEPLAAQLREMLAPLNVFLYSKAQEGLAGRDGVDAFREVFRTRARLAVVLFRARWGQTPWTRVEETAIKDHCLAEGWNHLFFVKLEAAQTPKWVPDSHLYLDFDAFGLPDLVGAVKARCAEMGVDLRPISAVEKARRLAEAETLAADTEFKLRTSPNPLNDACAQVFESVDRHLIDVDGQTNWAILRSRDTRRGYGAYTEPISVVLQGTWSSSGSESLLDVRLFRGRAPLPGDNRIVLTIEQPEEIRRLSFRLTRSPDLRWCWDFERRLLSSEAVASVVVDAFVEARGRHRPGA